MRVSQQLTKTLREAPRDIDSGSHELLVRGGYIRQLTAGVYSFLPIGNRVLRKIGQIMREEMDRAGGQEVTMPVLQPRELWEKRPADGKATRAEAYGDELFRLKDRKGRDMVLGPTHEDVVTTLTMEFVRSYRDLPQLVYQIQVKFRDQFRPRAGLLRSREFLMMDLYSFDSDEQGLDVSYKKIEAAFAAAFTRCGLKFVVLEADSGAIGGKDSQEFLAPAEAGGDDALLCDTCNYAANREKAEFVRNELPEEAMAELEKVYTPNCTTINDLAALLHIPAAKTMKAVCYVADSKTVLTIVRGDLEINEVKLSNILYQLGINAFDLHLATEEDLARAGIVAGYTSPMQKDETVLIIADHSLRSGHNFVSGADQEHYHIKNVNYPRDYRVDRWGDIASADDGATCARCGGILHTIRGTEIGHIFKIGTKYSDLFNATYLDADGNSHPILMGCYGAGVSRVMGAVVEQSHDEKGIIWPMSIAPYHVGLIVLDLDKEDIKQIAEKLYDDLGRAGIEVLFDDRIESAGVKFNDADLIGLPLRIVISKRSLKRGGVEMKQRSQKESRIVVLAEAIQAIQDEISRSYVSQHSILNVEY